eukprot:scaffold88267_cov66-Phaeocystis_antarctica.AAC.4
MTLSLRVSGGTDGLDAPAMAVSPARRVAPNTSRCRTNGPNPSPLSLGGLSLSVLGKPAVLGLAPLLDLPKLLMPPKKPIARVTS